MEQHDKSWTLYVFSSANVLRILHDRPARRLGVSWVWMGLEGEDSQYTKLHGIDTFALVRELQSHGIRVLGSTIIGLEDHTPENIDEVIDYAVRHNTDFHQFMLYTPIPGTPLHAELTAQGRMKDESRVPLGRHPRPVHLQLPASPHPRGPGNRDRMCGRSIATSMSTVRAWCGSFGRRWPVGSDTRTTPIRGFGGDSPGKPTGWPRPTPPSSAAREAVLPPRTPPCTPRCRRSWTRCTASSAGHHGSSATVGGPYVLWKIRQEERRLGPGVDL